MATLGSFLVALICVLPQYWYASYLDRTLAKRWKRLPTWGISGRVGPSSRRYALYEWPWFSTALAIWLVGLSAWNDIQPGVRSDREMVMASVIGIGFWSLIYPVRMYMVRRWIRIGKPRVRGMKHPSKNRD